MAGALAPRPVLEIGHLSRFQKGPEAPLWWGIVGLILVESSVVSGFIAAYFYLRFVPESAAQALPPPELLWPSVNVALLLASCATMWAAGRFLNRDRVRPFVLTVSASVLLAALTLPLRWWQFDRFGFRWDEHAYGSIVWTITGFHFMHVVSAVIGTAVVAVLGRRGFFSARQQIAVVVDTLYWYFVAAVWLPLYVVLYWSPRWL
jgi:cytochrome c oxidase subunit III